MLKTKDAKGRNCIVHGDYMVTDEDGFWVIRQWNKSDYYYMIVSVTKTLKEAQSWIKRNQLP
jgi:UDP-2,3-diacylglucosamine pyrophosphatase LpxH